MTFRHDINGLRAWAVIAVMLYHFDIPGVQGGFAGVDVFFVISGYLMTEIIFRRLQTNTFSFIDFYLARGRRIIPALTVLCAVLLLLGWFYLPSYEYAKLGKHVWGSTGFFSNYLYLSESGYFAKSSLSGKWLQHTWSLSVEWQFYLLYPLLAFAAYTLTDMRKARYLIAILATGSLGYCIMLSSMQLTDTAFFLLPSRIWELLAGALVYLFPITLAAGWKRVMELTGFALLLYAFNQMTGQGWPGWHALIPVTGAALILLAARHQSIFTSNAVLQWIGAASYSLYLWHWPIAHYLHKSSLLMSYVFSIGGIFVSIVMAALSWTLIEKSFQPRKTPPIIPASMPARAALPSMLLCSLLICLLGYAVSRQEGLLKQSSKPDSQSAKNDFLQKYEVMHKNLDNYYHFECGFFDEKTQLPKSSIDTACTTGVEGKTVFLWGDSHAQALSNGLRALVNASRYTVTQVATSQCKPSLSGQWETPTVGNNCDYANQFALQAIERLKPRYVVMAQEHYHEKTDWHAIASKLHELGVEHVILIGPVPQWDPSLPAVIVERHWDSNALFIEDQALYKDVINTDLLLHQQYDASPLLRYVSMLDVLCKNKTCQVKTPGDEELIALDYGHMTPKGSVYAVQAALNGVIVK